MPLPEQLLPQLLRAHRALLHDASTEMQVAFDSVSTLLSTLLEQGAAGLTEADVLDAVVKLQSVDAVGQRLEHVRQGLELIEPVLLDDAGTGAGAVAADGLRDSTVGLFTIESERRRFAEYVDS